MQCRQDTSWLATELNKNAFNLSVSCFRCTLIFVLLSEIWLSNAPVLVSYIIFNGPSFMTSPSFTCLSKRKCICFASKYLQLLLKLIHVFNIPQVGHIFFSLFRRVVQLLSRAFAQMVLFGIITQHFNPHQYHFIFYLS